MDPSSALWHELQNQPSALRGVIEDDGLRTGIAELATAVRASGEILLSGMGASLHAAEAVASVLRQHGIRAWTLPTSELLHYAPELVVEPVLLISQSGESAEVVHYLQRAAHAVHGLTLSPEGSLARAGGMVMPGGPEQAFAATRSFTSTVAAMLMLAHDLGVEVDLPGLPAALDGTLHREADLLPLLEVYRDGRTLLFTGRGPLHGLANYAALSFMELARVPAAGLESAQLRHGPLEVGQPDVVVTAFAGAGATADLVLKLAQDVAESGSPSIVLDASDLPRDASEAARARFERWRMGPFREVDAIVPLAGALQLLAYRFAEASGIPPGVPLRSAKVTREE